MSYKSNYKMKNPALAEPKNQKIQSMSIDENLYLLALVCTSNLETLKSVLIKNQMKFDINFNFIFKVPVQGDSTNLVEEVSELVELNEYYFCVEDYMRKNKLMKRLFCYYNVEKLESRLMVADNDISTSFDSGVGSYENFIGVKKNESEKDLVELVNDSIAKNQFFELTFLNIAIFLENYDCIRFILRNSAGLGKMKPNQIHSLHLALYQNNNTIFSMLLSQLSCEEIDSGVIYELSDDRGYNPIQIAVYYGNEEALSLLQSHGVDFNYNKKSSTQPLIWALENIDTPLKIIECLMNLGADPNCIDKTNGYTPLIVAVLGDRKDLVELLIKNHADVNKTINNPSACCALQVAIDRISQTNNYEIVETLLNAGANPTFYQRVDENNLQVRIFGGPFIDAISINSKYLVEKLLSFGANPNTDVNGTFSPICTACFLSRLEIIEILIKNKVDPLLKCKNSNTPLTVAISMNHENVINLLLPFYKTNESIDAQDANGDHALLYAAMNKNSILVKDLLKRGANPNLVHKYNASPLWYSVYNQDFDSFIALLPLSKNLDGKCNGVNYNQFQFPPELIYDSPLSYVELAEHRDCFSMIYFLKLFGSEVQDRTIKHLLSKLKHLRVAIKLKVLNENPKVHNDLRILESLVKFLQTPLKLTEILRLYFLKEKTILYSPSSCNMPENVEEFLNFKNYK